MEEMNVQDTIEVSHDQNQLPENQEQQIAENNLREETENQQRNFAKLREAKERAEFERDEAIRYIQQVQMQSHNKNVPVDDNDPAPDDIPEWRFVDRKIKNLEDQLKKYAAHNQNNMAETRLKSQFSDFDRVVTPENIDILRSTYPEIAQSLHATPDLYNKAVATYNIMKKFGIAKEYNQQTEYEKSLVQRNNSKPRATNSVAPQQGETPLNKANEFANGFLTPERKAQLYKEMMDARNSY
jgi:hypothetical protein